MAVHSRYSLSSTEGEGVFVHELTASGKQNDVSAGEADATIAMFAGRPDYEILHWWDQVSYTVAVRKTGELWPFISWGVGLPWVGQI